MAHYEQRLQRDLDNIKKQAAALASDAEQAVTNALQAVQTGNEKLAYSTILADARINRAHRELNKQCYRFIALHLPSAGPLRLIEALVRANIQFERLGDYAVTICREAIQMSKPPEGVIARELELISSHALRMLNQSIAAFNESNEDKARTTMTMGTDVEHNLDVVYADMTAEADPGGIKDLLAVFVVFNMVKRVTDQAKNICEEALFAVSGEYKPDKHHSILFVDEDGSLAPMAVAVARKMFSDAAEYSCASRSAAAGFDPATAAFMDKHGFDMGSIGTEVLDTDFNNISKYYVVVSLQGAVKSFIPQMPFHTSALDWDVGASPAGLQGAEAESRMEELYREIVVHVRDLLETITGKEAT